MVFEKDWGYSCFRVSLFRVSFEGGDEVLRLWQIMYYSADGLAGVVKVVRKRRPTKLARALMCESFTRFVLQQVA